jgi:tRNA(Ile)-lysidine synthase
VLNNKNIGMLIKKLKDFIESKKLISQDQKVLIACSGGRDSVVLAIGLQHLGYNIALAHCNFQLRGEDSHGDELFVKHLALDLDIPLHSIQFDTSGYAAQHNLSTQMAARDLRYAWFEDIMKVNDYSLLATAHHLDDHVETLLINMLRGTGLTGMHGIPVKRNNIIRPLLCASREDIDLYIKEHQIQFREDATNSQTKYMRNKIRHHILPVLQELNPSYLNTFFKNSQQSLAAENILTDHIDEIKKKLFIKEDKQTKVKIADLKKLNHMDDYLYYIFKDYEFNSDQLKDISQHIGYQSGKIFENNKWSLLIDREYVLIKEKKDSNNEQYIWQQLPELINEPISIKFQKQPFNDKLVIDSIASVALIDFGKIQFPLKIRRWQTGDKFQPLGMRGKKLLSDYFVDKKMSRFEKENIWVLEAKNGIIWIINHRLDDRFKLTKETTEVLKIELIEK